MGANRTNILLRKTKKCSNHESPLEQLKTYLVVKNHAQKCVERHRELANSKVEQLCKVSKPCLHDHQFRKEQFETVGELSKICPQIVLKYKLARAGTTWTRACDKRSARSISYTHHTCEFKQYCQVGKTAQHCRLGLFQDSDFAGDREDSKSTSEGVLCISGSRTFVPISWMCKKQTSVSHGSKESEAVSLDAGLRMEGIPALDLLDLVIEVLHSSLNQAVQGDLLREKRPKETHQHQDEETRQPR